LMLFLRATLSDRMFDRFLGLLVKSVSVPENSTA